MTIATVLPAFLLCVRVFAVQEGTASPVACNINAISANERPRYNKLMKRLRASVQGRSTLDNGYAYTLDAKAIALPEVAEWMSMERRCCPFLTVQVSTAGGQADWRLTLTGPEGTKALLEMEFSAR